MQHLAPMIRALRSELEWEIRREVRKAFAPVPRAADGRTPLVKSGADGRARDDGWSGSNGGSVDQRTPLYVNRNPSNHPDRRNLVRPGGRRSKDRDEAGVSPVEAALAIAPESAGHEEIARHAYKTAESEETIWVGSRGFDRYTQSRDGCTLYAEQGSNKRAFLKRDRTGAIAPWTSMQCAHGEFFGGLR